jgi:hypothetical protein
MAGAGGRRRSIRTGVRWMKFIFTPISILFGLIAGALAKRVFESLWRLVIHEQPPRPDREEVIWPKLIGALVLEGAIFRVAKGCADHAARKTFSGLTGAWVGENASE